MAQTQAPAPSGGSTAPTTSTPTTSTPTTSTPAAPKLTSVTPLVGQSRLTGAQIAAWFAKQGVTPTIVTPILDLANIFVDEGNAQNVRADIAFAQSVLETGWFAYKGSMVKATDNNFSGLGACDTCTSGNRYRTPAEGVRAQIQHLWAYGDPKADPLRVARELTDTRFSYVKPYGRSPTWETMGDGNWASGTDYAVNVLKLYNTMLVFNGLAPINLTMGTPAPVVAAAPAGPLTVLVSHTRAGTARRPARQERHALICGHRIRRQRPAAGRLRIVPRHMVLARRGHGISGIVIGHLRSRCPSARRRAQQSHLEDRQGPVPRRPGEEDQGPLPREGRQRLRRTHTGEGAQWRAPRRALWRGRREGAHRRGTRTPELTRPRSRGP